MALFLALFTEDGLTRDSAKANRARDLCKNWGVVFDSTKPSLIVFNGRILLNHLNSGDTFASFVSR